MSGELFGGHALKAKELAARKNGGRYFLVLGRGQDKHGVLGRLFESFKKSIKGVVGDLMRLIDNSDLVAAAGGRVTHVFAQLADLFDAAVGGGVNLQNIDHLLAL